MITVLIVDDEIWGLRGLTELLDWKALGFYICATAMNGLEALEKAKLHRPNVIVTDIKMPGMDGLMLMKKVREFDSEVILVAVSGFQEFEYARTAIKYKTHDYLLKPVTQEVLTEVLLDVRKRLEPEVIKEKSESASEEKAPEQNKIHEQSSEKLVTRIRDFVSAHYKENINLTSIAQQLNYDHKYLSKIFKQSTGINFTIYLTSFRIEKAKSLLKTDCPIQEIALSCGFKDYFYFCKVFKSQTGLTPTLFKKMESSSAFV